MPIAQPPGVLCVLSEEALVYLSSALDDIEWWRANVKRPDDFELPDLADVIPEEDLKNHDREALRRDLESVSAMVASTTAAGLKLAINSADSIHVICEVPSEVPGGEVSVSISGGEVTVELRLYCVHRDE